MAQNNIQSNESFAIVLRALFSFVYIFPKTVALYIQIW